MHNIEDIDRNFKINTKIDKTDIKFYNSLCSPFKIYGIYYEDGKFRRMPADIAKTVSPGVYSLHANTAGGRIRFKTDSHYIAINVKMPAIGKMSHFALCGSAGFDFYINGIHTHSFLPPFDLSDGYEGIQEMLASGIKDIEINFPLYSEVSELYIGLEETAAVLPPDPYEIEKPIVYYGSSVTQGGCASRPGTSYQGFISRALKADYINLGFSGNAKAEDEMADYIATLDMSVFVLDYDYNSPSAEHLKATHEKLFLKVRNSHPDLPIIILSMPKYTLSDYELSRRAIIEETYNNAIMRNDANVYFIDGPTLMSLCADEGTVDNTHPTDLGFYSMAQSIIEVLRRIYDKH